MGALRLQHTSVQVPDELFATCCDFYSDVIELFTLPPPDPPR